MSSIRKETQQGIDCRSRCSIQGKEKNVWETIEAAYIYAFPLVLMDATRASATNTEEPYPAKHP